VKIGFVGIGKLGLPVAETMANRHDVIGYDIRPRQSDLIQIAKSLKDAVTDREIIFVAVETPHAPEYDGSRSVENLPLKDFDYTLVKRSLTEMNQFVNREQMVVLISTVLPGTVRHELQKCIPNAELIYNPYLIAMGTERWDFLNPEMIIMGSQDGVVGLEKLKNFYQGLIQNNCRYVSGTWEEAESVKIFYNTFISAKLSLVNMIQDVAMRIGNMNVDVVTHALAHSTQRIMSEAYMVAGMGDGGPCHPRDNIALRWLSEKLDLGYDLFDAVIDSREGQARNLAEFLLRQSKKITILGKAFKPGVSLTTGSYSLLVADMIERLGGEVEFYDPETGDLELSFDGPHAYLISFWHKWVEDFQFNPGSTVVDPWRRMASDSEIHIVHYGNTRRDGRNVRAEQITAMQV
jgi:UDPglucose 6-dehydrogenase